jgi:hypothetical protein
MNSTELSSVTADPIQLVGMSYYFAPSTVERAKERGLNVFQFYGLGRGGVLGDVDYDVVFDAFTFFSHSAMGMLWTDSREKGNPAETAEAHVQAAYAYADHTFGAIPVEVLSKFALAVHKVAESVEAGHHALLDGYKQFAVPANPVHSAYLGAILMRELRGCVHIDAVREVGLTPAEAAYLQDSSVFKMHGYTDADVPTVTPELEAKKARAEEITSAAMAKYFEVLSDDERRALREGALAMEEAVKHPVPVTQ